MSHIIRKWKTNRHRTQTNGRSLRRRHDSTGFCIKADICWSFKAAPLLLVFIMYNLILSPQTISMIFLHWKLIINIKNWNNTDLFLKIVIRLDLHVFCYNVSLAILISLPFFKPRVTSLSFCREPPLQTLRVFQNNSWGQFRQITFTRTHVRVLGAESISTFGGRKQFDEWFTTLHRGCDILHNDSRPCHRCLSGRASTKTLLLTDW